MDMKVFAIHCHPDDIEFNMAGTMLLLKDAGCELHYMNISSGYLGSTEMPPEKTAEVRKKEAQSAAAFIGATFHDSVAHDLEIFYNAENIKKVAAVIRQVEPDILLLASPQDYMEDHMMACRIAVTAAFGRCIPFMETIPPTKATKKDVVLYHCMPHGLRDMLRHTIIPDFAVDITSVIDKKTEMLAFHESQKKWLDETQGFDSYLDSMKEICATMGKMTGAFQYAEGWRRHLHLGYSSREIDPLRDLLNDYIKDMRSEQDP